MDQEDSYETRAEFLMMWHGVPSYVLQAKYPKWYYERKKFKVNSVDEALWLTKFCTKAFELRTANKEES